MSETIATYGEGPASSRDAAVAQRVTLAAQLFGENGIAAAMSMVPLIYGCAQCSSQPTIFDSSPWAVEVSESDTGLVVFRCTCPRCCDVSAIKKGRQS